MEKRVCLIDLISAADYAYDEADSVRILVDEENAAETWWEAARETVGRGNYPRFSPDWVRGFVADLSSPWEICVPRDEAQKFQKWAESLPGWDEGPDHARFPLLIDFEEVKRSDNTIPSP